METVISRERVKAGKFKICSLNECNIINYSSRDGEYWPSVFFVRTSDQHSPVRPSRSVSKRLILFSPVAPYFGQTIFHACWIKV